MGDNNLISTTLRESSILWLVIMASNFIRIETLQEIISMQESNRLAMVVIRHTIKK